MKKIFIVLTVLFLCINPAASNGADEWYAGGTLHKKNMDEWYRASYKDRLATCADFVTNASRVSNARLFGNNARLLYTKASSLEMCITKSMDGLKLGHLRVSETAAMCLLLMGNLTND